MTTDASILNVDDTEGIRYAKTRILQRAGFSVIEAGTGHEALRMAAEHRPWLLLLDVKLPDISGLEVCGRVKQDLPGTLVLQTSASFIQGSDRARGLEAGADAYLVQPIEPEELVAAVRALQRMRRAESALRQNNDMLELRVAERTRELADSHRKLVSEIEERERAEDALRQAQKMEAVGQLTGGIAHDFNNLLTAIIGNLQLLQRRLAEGDTDVINLADGAMLAANRAASLTQRLLAFSRRQPLEPRQVDLNALTRSMADLLARTVGERTRVETMLTQDLWPARCDGNQMENALLNLAINARDAMPEGGTLTIETANLTLDDPNLVRGWEVPPGDYVRLSVHDTGVGMTPDVVAKAFDPFFTTKPIGQGTGLGLSMLYGFAKQSGGGARISSVPGAGTTVELVLPRQPGDMKAMTEIPATPIPVAPASCDERVLIVEDEDLVRMLVTETLEESGYTTIEAGDASTALQIIESDETIDLMITDIGLPGMNGRELGEAARARRPDLKILFMTGYAPRGTLADLASLGSGTQILNKPFSVEVLAEKVRGMMEGA